MSTSQIRQTGSPSSLGELVERERHHRFLRSRWFDGWCERANREIAIGLVAFILLAIKAMLGLGRSGWRTRQTIKLILANRNRYRDEANKRIVEGVVSAQATFFDAVENKPLTPRQREATASDEDATLVIAGAGTGKTSTIVAKIGLLLKTGQCGPSEILAISFTRKSADELAERVKDKLGVRLDIHTFHKLGLNIIAKAEDGKPRLAPFANDPEAKIKHIDRIIETLSESLDFKHRLVDFLAYHRVGIRQSWQFASMAEYHAWLKANKIVSLDGVGKKSYQECVIANWMLMHGIEFEYEAPYEHNTRTNEYRQYCPDFHVLKPNLYIEHFGVDKGDNPAPYIDAKQYQEGMRWKRDTHRKFGTTLIESYSWEHSEGSLIRNLEENLRQQGCKFVPISDDEVLEMMNKSGTMSSFAELVANFMTLYKGNGSRLVNGDTDGELFGFERKQAFMQLFDPIYREYERINKEAGQIDFEDMISRAADAVRERRFASPYRYILVDEFQDISPGRAELVKALHQSKVDCALFAVGDDWQSIYRFTGSDIGAMTHFSKVFGPTRQIFLDTTFRFDDYAIRTTSRFVLMNEVQIRKELKALRTGQEPSVILYKRAEKEAPLAWSVEQIAKEANGPATVLVLERYNFHLPDNIVMAELQMKHPNLSFRAMTVHGAKGLEADYVIAGLRGGRWGFPATKSDDPLLNLVLTQADAYPYSEERRLFYVALTRARRKSFLVCETGEAMSMFAAELDRERKEYEIAVFGLDTKRLACSKCKSGTMMLRDGSNGKFYGCSNYPLCDNMQQTCPICREGLLIKGDDDQWECHVCHHKAQWCPRCKTGILQNKSGKYGPFLGCSNYRDPDINCNYTESTNDISQPTADDIDQYL